MSDNQASSYRYFIPVVLIVLSLITSVLFSRIYFQEPDPGSENQVLADSEETEASEEEDSTSDIPESSDDSTADSVSVAETESEPQPDSAAVTTEDIAGDSEGDSEGDSAAESSEAEEQPEVPVIADLTVLVPGSNDLCEGQSPWRKGARPLSEVSGASGCYGLRFELAKPATVLLLKLSDDAVPRSLLSESCRPFGFNSARFEPEQVQRLPRGVDSQPGVFQVGSAPARTRFVLVAAEQPQEQFTSLENGVANLCGQNGTLSNEQVQAQLETLSQLDGVAVEEVTGEL